MILGVEYYLRNDPTPHVEIYGQSALPRSTREVRRTLSQMRYGSKRYARFVKLASVEVLRLAS